MIVLALFCSFFFQTHWHETAGTVLGIERGRSWAASCIFPTPCQNGGITAVAPSDRQGSTRTKSSTGAAHRSLSPDVPVFQRENCVALLCCGGKYFITLIGMHRPSHTLTHATTISKNMISGSTGYFSKTRSLYIVKPAKNVHSWCDSKKQEESHQAKSNYKVISNAGKVTSSIGFIHIIKDCL